MKKIVELFLRLKNLNYYRVYQNGKQNKPEKIYRTNKNFKYIDY